MPERRLRLPRQRSITVYRRRDKHPEEDPLIAVVVVLPSQAHRQKPHWKLSFAQVRGAAKIILILIAHVAEVLTVLRFIGLS